ncbi:neuronal acetylcholine receptor subunit alpha-7-like [Haliotis rubra]|uniref:neuronal acetylcholine receptor subunit alpha-7-like n=1 Tax=Haliotis rubra TaxID=36100 RepID=UPI001EE5F7E6|nr:neuronal acetylcholine receptor subunit alpha-7-like [Haliotis rubra]
MWFISTFTLLILLSPSVMPNKNGNVRELHSSLLQNYNPWFLPLQNLSDPTYVDVTFKLISIERLDVVKGVFTSHLWLTFEWVDELIQWNPTEYSNTTHLRFQRNKIWTPNIVIQDTLAYVPYLGSDELPVIVTSDGSARFDVEVKAQTFCKIVITAFPFDHHECKVVIGSDNYFLSELYISYFEANEFSLVESPEWEVLQIKSQHESELTRMYNLHWFSVSISLKRQSLYYVVNLVLPILIISTLNPFVFLVKAETGEKLSISITLFLSFTVFVTLISGMLPQTSSSASLISLYVCVQLHLSGLYVICCIFIQRVSHMQAHNKATRFMAKMGKMIRTKRIRQLTEEESKEQNEVNDRDECTYLKCLSDNMDITCFYISLLIFTILTSALMGFIIL